MNHNLAIIIPYFKIEFFEKSLESLAQQTDKRFQVYIGDDASPNSPESLLDKYQGKFNFTYKRFENNLGSVSLVKQWERCIDMMQDEEWFMILGDDDVLTENVVFKYNENLNHVIKQESNLIRFDYRQIDSNDNFTSNLFYMNTLIDPVTNLIEKFKSNHFTSLSQYIFKKETFLKYGFIDLPLAWASDDLAVFQTAENKSIYNINEPIYIRISEINISGSRKFQKEKNDALLKFYSILLSKYKFKKLDFDFLADLYFNQLLINYKFKEIIIFFKNILFKVSYKKNIYFLKAFIYKFWATIFK